MSLSTGVFSQKGAMYMAKKKKTNCYIYTRVSTAMQVDGFRTKSENPR